MGDFTRFELKTFFYVPDDFRLELVSVILEQRRVRTDELGCPQSLERVRPTTEQELAGGGLFKREWFELRAR